MSARVLLRHKKFFFIQMCIHQGVFPSSALVSAPFNAGVIPQTVCIPHSWLCVMNNVFFFLNLAGFMGTARGILIASGPQEHRVICPAL